MKKFKEALALGPILALFHLSSLWGQTSNLAPLASVTPLVSQPSESAPTGMEEPALSNWRMAKAGASAAMFNLGVCYEQGFGVPVDHRLAGDWFRRAVQKNYLPAFKGMADWYHVQYNNGKMPMEAAITSSREWYEKGAVAGDPECQLQLAALELEGRGGQKNTSDAIGWLSVAADNGYGPGAAGVASLYLANTLAKRDLPLAYLWARLAENYGGLDPDVADRNRKRIQEVSAELARSDVKWLDARYLEILQLKKHFGYALVDTGPKELVQPSNLAQSYKLLPQAQGIIKVSVSFDGKSAHNFLVDTGSSSSTIDPSVARELHLQIVGQTAVYDGGLIQAPIFSADGDVAGVKFQNLRLIGIQNHVDPSCDGILGGDFLRFLQMRLDTKEHTITLQTASLTKGTPISFFGTRPYVTGTVVSYGKKQLSDLTLIDTGNEAAVQMGSALEDEVSFSSMVSNSFDVSAVTATTSGAEKMGQIASVTVGGFRVEDPFLSTNHFAGASKLIVGVGVLSRFLVTIDYPHALLELQQSDLTDAKVHALP